jgi:hypothetical protein
MTASHATSNTKPPSDSMTTCPIRSALTTLIASCEEALDRRWDRSDDGFEAMIQVAERALASLDEVHS